MASCENDFLCTLRALSILKTIDVSQESKEKMLNASSENLSATIRNLYLESLGISKYSGKVLLIISVDIHRQLTQCVRT